MARKRENIQKAGVLWVKMPCWHQGSEENGQTHLSWQAGNSNINNLMFLPKYADPENIPMWANTRKLWVNCGAVRAGQTHTYTTSPTALVHTGPTAVLPFWEPKRDFCRMDPSGVCLLGKSIWTSITLNLQAEWLQQWRSHRSQSCQLRTGSRGHSCYWAHRK